MFILKLGYTEAIPRPVSHYLTFVVRFVVTVAIVANIGYYRCRFPVVVMVVDALLVVNDTHLFTYSKRQLLVLHTKMRLTSVWKGKSKGKR